MLFRRLLLAFVCLVTVGLAGSEVHAQTGSSSGTGTTTGTDSIALASGLTNPYRFLCPSGEVTCDQKSQTDVTNTPRPQNLNPTGCSFTDCEGDLRLDFPLVISGFNGDHIEVWAGNIDCTQDANRNQVSTATAHPCWPVAGNTGPLYAVSTSPLSYSIFARDVLRFSPPPQQGVQQLWSGSFHNSPQGETDACHVQTSDAAVSFSIYFIPVNSAFQAVGTAYMWPLNTDLVAPPPPPSVTLQSGDTLLSVSWTSPGDDPDITGFALWSDPPAAGATSGGCSCGSSPGSGASSYVGADAPTVMADVTQYRCIDAESDATADGEVEGAADAPVEAMESGAVEASMMEGAAPEASMPMPEASTDGAPEAAASEGGTDAAGGGDGGVTDAGDGGMVNCNPINVGGGGGSCNSTALTGRSFVIGGGSSSVFTEGGTPVYDDAGNIISTGGEGGEALSGGGIAEIAPQYKGYELDDRVPSQITLTGFKNGETVAVVVTSIDAFGNVGPVSTPQCGQPEPTSDFWKTYKGDNGSASGCALEAGDGSSSDLPLLAFGIAVTGAAFMRRRRTRR